MVGKQQKAKICSKSTYKQHYSYAMLGSLEYIEQSQFTLFEFISRKQCEVRADSRPTPDKFKTKAKAAKFYPQGVFEDEYSRLGSNA